MARKRKHRNDDDDSSSYDWGSVFARDSIRAVWGIFCLAVTIFLILAAFGFGGMLGDALYALLSRFAGVGYALLPVSFGIGAFIFFRAVTGNSISGWQIGSTIVFLLSSLGLLNVMLPGKGGIVGELISKPLLTGLDTPATVTFLLAFTGAALVIAFDVHPVSLIMSIFPAVFVGSFERDAPRQGGYRGGAYFQTAPHRPRHVCDSNLPFGFHRRRIGNSV